jgi:hypothetical protein
MEVCYWALLFMPLVILHHLLNVFVQLANKKGFKQKKICSQQIPQELNWDRAWVAAVESRRLASSAKPWAII